MRAKECTVGLKCAYSTPRMHGKAQSCVVLAPPGAWIKSIIRSGGFRPGNGGIGVLVMMQTPDRRWQPQIVSPKYLTAK